MTAANFTALPLPPKYVTTIVVPTEAGTEAVLVNDATVRLDCGCLITGNADVNYIYAPGEWMSCFTVRQNG